MAELKLTLTVRTPWWWGAAVWLSAMPIFVRYALTDGPPEQVTDTFAERWAQRYARHAKVIAV